MMKFKRAVTVTLVCLLTFFSTFIEARTIKIGIVLPAPPTRIHMLWQPTAEYLAEQLGQPVELVTPKELGAIKKALRDHEIDILYINSYAYYLLKQDGNLNAFAQMKNTGDSIYSVGRIIVRNDSGINSISDLKGKQVALISKIGAGAYLAPRAHFARQNLNIEEEVDIIYTKSLKKSVYSVLHGDSAAAVMCGVNYNILSSKIDTGDIKVLESTEKFPEAVVAARTDIPEASVKKLAQIFVNMANTTEGKTALEPLNNIKIDSFVDYDPEVETITQKMIKEGNL